MHPSIADQLQELRESVARIEKTLATTLKLSGQEKLLIDEPKSKEVSIFWFVLIFCSCTRNGYLVPRRTIKGPLKLRGTRLCEFTNWPTTVQVRTGNTLLMN